MKLPTLSQPARIIAALIGVVLVVGLAAQFLFGPSRARKDAAVANATAVTADASKGSAQDTVKILVETQAALGRIDVVTQGNRDAILAAPGASAEVGSGVHHAGLAALCLRDTYRLQPACVGLLHPGAEGAGGPDAGGSTSR